MLGFFKPHQEILTFYNSCSQVLLYQKRDIHDPIFGRKPVRAFAQQQHRRKS